MGCLILSSPRCFATPLRSPEILTKEIPMQKVDNMKLPCPATSVTVIKLIAPKCWDRGIDALRSCHHHVVIQSRYYSELISCYSNVRFVPSAMVIWGFWMGPDIEDGWGFVEAVVNQIF